MSPDPVPPFDPEGSPSWEEEYGPERAVAPSVEECVECASGELRAALAEERATWDALFSDAGRELADARTGVHLSMSALIGQIDAELREHSAPVYKSIDNVGDKVIRELILAEESLRVEGIDVPSTPESRRALLDDPTGELVLGLLTGSALSVLPSGFVERPAVVPESEPWPEPPASPPPPSPPPPPGEACECEKPEPACPAPVVNVLPAPVTVVPADSGVGALGDAVRFPGAPEPSPPEPVRETGPVEPAPSPEPAPKPKVEFFDAHSGLVPGAPIGVAPPGPAPPDPRAADPSVISPWVPQWHIPGVCGAAQRALSEIAARPENKTGKPLADRSTDTISGLYRKGVSGVKAFVDFAFDGFDTKTLQESYRQSMASTGDILGGTTRLRAAIDGLPPEIAPNKDVAWTLGMTVATFHDAAQEMGFPGDQLVLPYTYLFNYQHPWAIPAQGELDTLYATGKYTFERWSCLTRAHGNDPDMRGELVELAYTRPSPSEIAILKRRGYFDVEPADYRELMRLAGVAPTNERWYEELTAFVPGASDIVRFMTRDAMDDAVAKRYNLDKDFETKLYGAGGKVAPGQAADWMRANGVSEEQMRAFWRAHWDIPSNTALYEMYHRLREDRAAVAEWDDRATGMDADAAVKRLGPRPPVVALSDVRRALEINDMAPEWVDPLLAISFHPINRTDLIDGYHAGSVSEAQFISGMRDNGYSPENAKSLLDIQRAKKGARLANQSGVMSVRKVMRYYREGAITSARADELMAPVIIDPVQRQRLIQGADAEAEADVRVAFLKRARRAYFTGGWTDEGLAIEFQARGIDPARGEQLRRQWFHEREGRFKEPSAKMVVDWCKHGIISPDDAYARLRRIGYDDVDTRRIVAQGIVAQNRAIEAEMGKQERALNAVVTSMRKARKTEEAALKAREKEIRDDIERMSKEGERIRKELASRLPGQ